MSVPLLTVSQLSNLNNILHDPNLGETAQVVTYYQTLAAYGVPYGNLGLGVVTNSTMIGQLANNFLLNAAADSGAGVNGAEMTDIEHDLAAADLAARTKGQGADLTGQDIESYHQTVFGSYGLPITAWTGYVPYTILGEPGWQQMLSGASGDEIQVGLEAIANAGLDNMSQAVGWFGSATKAALSTPGALATDAAESLAIIYDMPSPHVTVSDDGDTPVVGFQDSQDGSPAVSYFLPSSGGNACTINNPDGSGSVFANDQLLTYVPQDIMHLSFTPAGDAQTTIAPDLGAGPTETVDLTSGGYSGTIDGVNFAETVKNATAAADAAGNVSFVAPLADGGSGDLVIGANGVDRFSSFGSGGLNFTAEFNAWTPGGSVLMSGDGNAPGITVSDGPTNFTQTSEQGAGSQPTVDVSGNGDVLDANDSVINLAAGTRAAVDGDGNTINAGAGAAVSFAGDDNTVYDSGILVARQLSGSNGSETLMASGQTVDYPSDADPTVTVDDTGVQAVIHPFVIMPETIDLTAGGIEIDRLGAAISDALPGASVAVDDAGDISITSSALGDPVSLEFLRSGTATFTVGGTVLNFDAGSLQSISSVGGAIDFGIDSAVAGYSESLSLDPATGQLAVNLTQEGGQPITLALDPVNTGDTLLVSGSTIETDDADGKETSSSTVQADGTVVDTTVNSDGSVDRSFSEIVTGSWLYTSIFGKNGDLFSLQTASNITFGQFTAAVSDALAGQIISQYLIKNNLPASMAARAFVKTGIQAITGDTAVTAGNFTASFGASLTGMAGGLLGSQEGASLFKSLGLPVQLGSLAGNALGQAAAQQLSAYVLNDVLHVSPNLTAGLAFSPTFDQFATSFGNDFLSGGVSLAGEELAGLLVPSNNTAAQIVGSIGAAVGSFLGPIGTFLGDFLGTLIGDLFNSIFGGDRGIPFADAHMVLSNNRLVDSSNTEDNNGVLQVSATMENHVIGIVNAILADMGGTVSLGTGWNVGYYQDQYFSFDGTVWPPPGNSEHGSADDADANAVLGILSAAKFSGNVDPVLMYALDTSLADATGGTGSESQNLQIFLNDFDAAYDYSRYLANPAVFDVDLIEFGNAAAFQLWQTEVPLARRLGLDGLTVTPDKKLVISNTSAEIFANSAGLAKLAASGTIASISFTDSQPSLSVTPARLTALGAFFGEIATPYDLTVTADPNVNETIAGIANATNTISFASETQGVTVDLSKGTATTIHTNPTSGTPPFIALEVVVVTPLSPTTTFTYNLSGFQSVIGSSHADTLIAGGPGQTLAGGGGADTLVGFSGGGTSFSDTAANLSASSIQALLSADAIDVTDLIPSAIGIGYTQTNSGSGTLTISSNGVSAAITLAGQFTDGRFYAHADGKGGTDAGYVPSSGLAAFMAAHPTGYVYS